VSIANGSARCRRRSRAVQPLSVRAGKDIQHSTSSSTSSGFKRRLVPSVAGSWIGAMTCGSHRRSARRPTAGFLRRHPAWWSGSIGSVHRISALHAAGKYDGATGDQSAAVLEPDGLPIAPSSLDVTAMRRPCFNSPLSSSKRVRGSRAARRCALRRRAVDSHCERGLVIRPATALAATVAGLAR